MSDVDCRPFGPSLGPLTADVGCLIDERRLAVDKCIIGKGGKGGRKDSAGYCAAQDIFALSAKQALEREDCGWHASPKDSLKHLFTER